MIEPGYVNLHATGELARRGAALEPLLSSCLCFICGSCRSAFPLILLLFSFSDKDEMSYRVPSVVNAYEE